MKQHSFKILNFFCTVFFVFSFHENYPSSIEDTDNSFFILREFYSTTHRTAAEAEKIAKAVHEAIKGETSLLFGKKERLKQRIIGLYLARREEPYPETYQLMDMLHNFYQRQLTSFSRWASRGLHSNSTTMELENLRRRING